MRATALVRWGITCLLLAPLAFLSWLLSADGRSMQTTTPEPIVALATTWGVLAPIVAVLLVLAGAVLNALAIRRGVRGVERVASGEWDASVPPHGPRLIFPGGWEETHPVPADPQRLSRRALSWVIAAGLLAWVAFVAWVLIVSHPLAIAGGQRDLGAVYDAWGPVSRSGFVVAVVVWMILAAVGILVVILAGRSARGGLERILAPRRFVAFAAVLASALTVAAMPAYLTLGVSLVDDANAAFGTRAGGGPSAGSWFVLQGGVALSALAILLTGPSWRRRPRAGSVDEAITRG